MALIELRKISKRFARHIVLRKVSLDIEAGVHGTPIRGLWYDLGLFWMEFDNRTETQRFSSTEFIIVNSGNSRHRGFEGEVTSTLKRRPEGVCLRHTVNGNSIKVYDKQGSVLRVETTVVHPEQFKVYRPAEGDTVLRRGTDEIRPGTPLNARLAKKE